MHLVQREDERTLLRHLYDECLRGQGHIAHITGPVGSGKSALLHDLIDHVTALGASHLPVSAVPGEQDIPFALINQLMQAAGLPAYEPGTESAPCAPPVGLIPRLQELCRVLMPAPEDMPLLLHIDDVHLSDGVSLTCLAYLLRRLCHSPVMVVITECPPPNAVTGTHLSCLTRLPGYRRIRVRHLDAEGIRELMAARNRTPISFHILEKVLHLTGGVPALVHALLEDTGAAAHPTPGESYRTAFTDVLLQQPAPVLDLVMNVAVMEETSTPTAFWQRLLGQNPETEMALLWLRNSGLLGSEGLLHPEARAAVLSLLAPDRRATVHLHCARMLYEAGAPITHIARHLRDAGRVEEPWAVPLLTKAAEQAMAEGDQGFAMDCLEAASMLCDDDDTRARVSLSLAGVLWRVNPEAATRHLLRMSDTGLAARLPACERFATVRGLLWAGNRVEAEDIIRRPGAASDEGADAADDLETGITYLTCVANHPGSASLFEDLPELGAVANLPRLATSRLRYNAAEALAAALRPSDGDETTVARAEEILTNASLGEHMVEAVFAATSALIYTDRLEQASYWADVMLQMPDRSPLWYAQAHLLRGHAALRAGDTRTGRRHSLIALNSLSSASWGVVIGLLAGDLILIAEAEGNHQEAARLVAEPVDEELFRSRYGLHFLHARGVHHLNAGRYEAALADFSVCGELMITWDMDTPTLVPWRGGAARAHFHSGRVDEARELALDQQALVPQGRERTSALVMRDMAAVGLSPHDGVGTSGQTPHHAESGTEAARSGDRIATRFWRLTRAEWRVAALAAQGLTNRQISARLHITTSTVEQHLTRVYRKVGVTSRQEIAGVIEQGVADETATA